ncbi:MAG: hypothetical protein IPO09_19660 [Anaeromyxobacter sp.]|nr:hypothetical protein [Anaeromyxobacter sp.]MBL0274986.1 hypothetical protein [Anaeromyxobacter sp.]
MLAPVLALALGAGLLPPASPLETAQPARPRVPGVGRVLQVTGARAYLDAGADEGLAPGQVVALWRGEEEIGRCTVEAVGPGGATCSGGQARAGDAFKLAPVAAPTVKVVTLPALPTETELARRGAVVAAAPVAAVEFKAAPKGAPKMAAPRGTVAEVALGDALWTSSGSDSWDVARLDASVHGAAVGPLTLDLDLRAEQWLARGPATFRPQDDTRLYVWQAQLAWARPGGGLSLAAGRILPWTVPGATVMDGALMGVRREGWEAGLFGGLVPEPDTLNPSADRATAGGFWSLERRLGRVVVLRHEGRLAWVRSPELGDRAELEAGAALHAGPLLDLYASARLATGGLVEATGALDAARVELLLRPFTGLSLSGGFDYGGLAVPWLVAPPAFGSRNRRADLTAFYDLGVVRVGLAAGTSRDEAASLERTWVGPEVQLPQLFTPRLSLAAGYLEELGWLHGRSAWVQGVLRPRDALRLISRLSWSHEQALGLQREEVGLSLSAAAELTRHVGVRLSLLGRTGFDATGGEGQALPLGLNASAAVYAAF